MKKESSWKSSFYILIFLTTILYIVYRIFFTIPDDSLINIIFAILVLLVEIVDAIFFSFYLFNILIYKKESPKIPKINKKDYPDVDVFIATINESKELLEKTIIACKNMDYPDKKKVHIYVCDDGRRSEIKDLCKKLKIKYLARDNNIDAKAGNYNNAIKNTNSPYIAMFDADMCPSKKFLLKTIPFFIKEDKMGFVQLPQSFIELDLFQSKFKLINKIPFEQDYFYHQIQMAKNNTNSVICCGTNMVMSRNALDDVDGFATKTITEDIATGMLIEAAGYKAIAIPDDEVFGMNVTSTESLIKQRSRWCRGCIQIFKNYKIINNKNLSTRQKLDYLSAIYYWFFGLRNIFYLLVPLLFSIFNIRVIECNVITFLVIFSIQYILKRYVIDKMEENKVSSTWNRIYEIILSPVIAYDSLKELLGFGSIKFEVTSKDKNIQNKSKKSILLYFSHLLLLLLTIVGIVLSAYKGYNLGINIYYIPLFWLCTNLVYLVFALIFDNSSRLLDEKYIKTYKYKFNSTPTLLINYIKHELRLKEWLGIFFLAVFSVFFIKNNFTKIEFKEPIRNKNLVSYNNYLKVNNGKLVNSNNEIVHLRGVSTHNLYYYGDLYDYDNIKELRDTWGINVFRIAMYTDPNEEGYIKNNNLKEKVEEIVEDCIDLDIYVIIDWHILNDNNPETYEKEALEFFDEMSTRFQDVPNVIYEICNEPNGKDVTWNGNIKPYAEKTIKTIRNNSEDSLVLVGTADWSKDLESVRKNPLKDKNIMYVLHTYPKGEMDIIRANIENAIRERIPIIITECSVTDPTGDGKLYKDFFKDWIKYIEKNDISWVVWQLSDKNESSSLLISQEKVWKERLEKEDISEEELKKEDYNINNYLSETGEFIKDIISSYSNINKEVIN
ncbi:MAG: cellulase family glycosylhydrolase [Bacilli bacterium]|nr:cellulase family glycosylhydrolase [Bacilli bacterium]